MRMNLEVVGHRAPSKDIASRRASTFRGNLGRDVRLFFMASAKTSPNVKKAEKRKRIKVERTERRDQGSGKTAKAARLPLS